MTRPAQGLNRAIFLALIRAYPARYPEMTGCEP